MKNYLIFLFVLSFQLLTIKGNAQEQKIELGENPLSIKQIIRAIEKQTDYLIVYKSDEIDDKRKVLLHSTSAKVSSVLDEIFRDKDIEYNFENNYIILSRIKKVNNKNVSNLGLSKTLKGIVSDTTGEAIVGVTITVQGRPLDGAVTDIEGRYILEEVPQNAVITVSYIGMKGQEISTDGKNVIDITLYEDSELLDEVVVIGYGMQKKVNVIGSVSVVDSKDLEARTSPSISNILTGQMSGVTIIQGGGRPGDDSGSVRVRGVGSFGASPEPLVLIDGIPGELNSVSSSDIQSISVLKDASSAAIYGSRAANGVILVQTKQGKEGRISIGYNGYIGWNKASELPDFLRAYEFASYFNLAAETEAYSEEDIQKIKDGVDSDIFADEAYIRDIIGGKGLQMGHEVSINGGSSKTQYMVSLGYLRQEGLMEKNHFNRYNSRINLKTKLGENVELIARISGIVSNRAEPAIPGGVDVGGDMTYIVSEAVRYPGLWTTKMSDGSWGDGPKLLGTPNAWLKSPSFYKRNSKVLTSLAELSWEPLKGLKIKAIGGFSYTNVESKRYRSTLKLYGGRTIGPSELDNELSNKEYKTLQVLVEYSTKIKEHEFSILGGYTWEDEQYSNVRGGRNNFPSNEVPYLNAGATEGQQAMGGKYEWAILSSLGRLAYNYGQRYLLESTLRYDGSSRFPEKNRFGLFPSVSIGWRVSEESFFRKQTTLDFVNGLKLKASLGSLGNNNIGNYPYQQVYELDSRRSYVFGGQIYSGAAVVDYKDSALTWEKTNTMDVGLESNLWNNKLVFNINYFYRKTIDILYKPDASYSSIFGLNLSPVNTGSLENKGWEFEVEHRNKIGNLSYHLRGNFSIINNKVLSLGIGNVEQQNGMIGNGSDLFINFPMQMYYGYKTDGVFLNEEEINEWADQTKVAKGTRPGDLRYIDVNGDNIIDEKDKVFLGSRIPKYTFGLNIGVEWKNFDFSTLLQGVTGVEGYLNAYAGLAFYQQGNIQRWQAEGTWTKNQNERYPEYPRLEVISNAGTPNTLPSDFWVLDASYIKIRNIQLGYNFNKSLISRLGFVGLRFYFSADNPFSFSNYRKGWDPEINTWGPYYPILSTYTFGVNIKF